MENAEDEAVLFLPTPSARRATLSMRAGVPSGTISTHALREEGDREERLNDKCPKISTHALREEGDSSKSAKLTRR